MAIFYGIVCLVSAVLLGIFFIVDKKRNIWLMLLFISIFVCNSGYFLLSVSNTISFALISNSIAYLGNVFLPFFMLMLVLDVCHIKHSKKLIIALLVLGVVMLFIATSGGYLPIYYKQVWLQAVNGGYKLVKEYGPLHLIYYAYLFGYFASMVSITIYAILKNKLKSKMHAVFLSVVVFGNILVWLIEQFVPHNFEFLCVSYIVNECLLLMLYGMLQEYGLVINNKNKTINENVKEEENKEASINFTQEQINSIFANYKKLTKLTTREKDVLKLILSGEKRKNIANLLFITESAVKKHTANIFKKLEVENRTELYKKAKKYV